MIITIIDPTQFNSPLAFPNPKLVGNLGERTLQFHKWYFNPGLIVESITTPLLVTFGPITESFDRNITVQAGINTGMGPVTVLTLDRLGAELPDGEYTLRVEHGNAVASIVVRVDQTHLHLVSAWPSDTNMDAAAELRRAEAQVTILMSTITDSQDKLVKLNARIPKLKALLDTNAL